MELTLTQRNAILAKYAAGVYTPDQFGMNPLMVEQNPGTGFYAAAYFDDTLGKTVVVFRGVDGFNDGGSALALWQGTWHPQFDDALNFVARIADRVVPEDVDWRRNPEVLKSYLLVTGHSQGGGETQLSSRLFGLDGAAFDPAGASRQTLLPEFVQAAQRIGIDLSQTRIPDSFRNYPIKGSAVPGSTGPHLGEARELPPYATAGIADVLKGVAVGWLASNPVLFVLSVAVMDQFGYRHPIDNIAAALDRMAQLEADPNLNPGGGEIRFVSTNNGYAIRNGAGDLLGQAEFRDGKLILSDQTQGAQMVFSESGLESVTGVTDSGWSTLMNGASTYGPTLIDALTLVRAIQTGEPLPVVASGLRVANDLSNLNDTPNLILSGAANAASGILSLYGLANALERGDGIAAVSAGAQAVSFAASAYANFLGYSGNPSASALQQAIAAGEFGAAGQAIGAVSEALPYLNLINSIAHGDETGAAVAVVDLVMMKVVGAYSIPVIGWAYAVYSLIDSLFGDEPDIPDPWGSGQFVWDGTGIAYRAVGETGGDQAVSNVMNNTLAVLNSLIERERSQNPGSQLGLIPNRMPSVGYDMAGYRYTDIDPLTGAEKHPQLRFDTSGRPYNAEAGSPESYQSIIEGMVRSALSRGAIAPLWEVQTAKLQTDAGDPKAGLTEEERAGRDGQLAAQLTGATQTFRPVALDLDGDGIEVTDRAHGVAFDVDDSGYLKQTAWVKGDDALLVLDRNYNGSIDSGKELFSNGRVALGRRGLAGMNWVDANYDGRLTADDPVWNELRLWRDLDQDGSQDAGEVQSLQDAGITELNYAMGTFTHNGVMKRLASPDLEADSQGSRVSVVPEGILVQASENGRLSLLVTRIDDKTQVEANRDGVTGYEDVEIIVSPADLLANDTLGGIPGRELSITGLTNFRHGTGFIASEVFKVGAGGAAGNEWTRRVAA